MITSDEKKNAARDDLMWICNGDCLAFNKTARKIKKPVDKKHTGGQHKIQLAFRQEKSIASFI